MTKHIKSAAKTIIIKDGKVLLNKCLNTYGDFAWGLPNGAIYYDLPGGGKINLNSWKRPSKENVLKKQVIP